MLRNWTPAVWSVMALLVIAEIAWMLSPVPPQWVERYYSSGAFALMTRPLVAVQEMISFSMTALLAIALVAVATSGSVAATWRMRQRGDAWRRIGWTLCMWGGVVLLIGHTLFLITFGVGYKRKPIENRLQIATDTAVTRADIEGAMQAMLSIITDDVKDAETRDARAAMASIRRSMGDLVMMWDGHRPSLPKDVKQTPPGFLITFGAYGVNAPVLMEPHVDAALPEPSYLSTAAHEFAHVAGFSSEAEATFVGLLAGLHADHPYARYSAALSAYANLLRELDVNAQREAISMLPPQALDDLRAEAQSYHLYTRDVTESVFRPMYNSYLLSQGVTEGIKDYSRGTRLFVQAWRQGLVRPQGAKAPRDE